MHAIETDVDRPDPDVVTAFEDVPSSVVSDVTGNAGVAMDADIGPVHAGAGTAGTALTVKAVPGDNLIVHRAITMAEPGDVLVVDGDGYTGTAYLGELMCASCRANGLAGVVVDGAVRDRAEIAEMGFPLYARGVHPAGPCKQDSGSINVTVSRRPARSSTPRPTSANGSRPASTSTTSAATTGYSRTWTWSGPRTRSGSAVRGPGAGGGRWAHENTS